MKEVRRCVLLALLMFLTDAHLEAPPTPVYRVLPQLLAGRSRHLYRHGVRPLTLNLSRTRILDLMLCRYCEGGDLEALKKKHIASVTTFTEAELVRWLTQVSTLFPG